ncbi:hypothetical protein BESB_047700 [Besnoitia besnoiti]|uniref:Uncharacterized protein n=1 Tax=Besnoitia besnoiti TaxID=94643 RepID=A0A2A9MDJ7_BESBE|nr:hypothetical protein BESB_047700 [Besnoitia besnoiti]PFH36578.1 hypothetical protein BESB_047700 [Besnoitia besnoiti]
MDAAAQPAAASRNGVVCSGAFIPSLPLFKLRHSWAQKGGVVALMQDAEDKQGEGEAAACPEGDPAVSAEKQTSDTIEACKLREEAQVADTTGGEKGDGRRAGKRSRKERAAERRRADRAAESQRPEARRQSHAADATSLRLSSLERVEDEQEEWRPLRRPLANASICAAVPPSSRRQIYICDDSLSSARFRDISSDSKLEMVSPYRFLPLAHRRSVPAQSYLTSSHCVQLGALRPLQRSCSVARETRSIWARPGARRDSCRDAAAAYAVLGLRHAPLSSSQGSRSAAGSTGEQSEERQTRAERGRGILKTARSQKLAGGVSGVAGESNASNPLVRFSPRALPSTLSAREQLFPAFTRARGESAPPASRQSASDWFYALPQLSSASLFQPDQCAADSNARTALARERKLKTRRGRSLGRGRVSVLSPSHVRMAEEQRRARDRQLAAALSRWIGPAAGRREGLEDDKERYYLLSAFFPRPLEDFTLSASSRRRAHFVSHVFAQGRKAAEDTQPRWAQAIAPGMEQKPRSRHSWTGSRARDEGSGVEGVEQADGVTPGSPGASPSPDTVVSSVGEQRRSLNEQECCSARREREALACLSARTASRPSPSYFCSRQSGRRLEPSSRGCCVASPCVAEVSSRSRRASFAAGEGRTDEEASRRTQEALVVLRETEGDMQSAASAQRSRRNSSQTSPGLCGGVLLQTVCDEGSRVFGDPVHVTEGELLKLYTQRRDLCRQVKNSGAESRVSRGQRDGKQCSELVKRPGSIERTMELIVPILAELREQVAAQREQIGVLSQIRDSLEAQTRAQLAVKDQELQNKASEAAELAATLAKMRQELVTLQTILPEREQRIERLEAALNAQQAEESEVKRAFQAEKKDLQLHLQTNEAKLKQERERVLEQEACIASLAEEAQGQLERLTTLQRELVEAQAATAKAKKPCEARRTPSALAPSPSAAAAALSTASGQPPSWQLSPKNLGATVPPVRRKDERQPSGSVVGGRRTLALTVPSVEARRETASVVSSRGEDAHETQSAVVGVEGGGKKKSKARSEVDTSKKDAPGGHRRLLARRGPQREQEQEEETPSEVLRRRLRRNLLDRIERQSQDLEDLFHDPVLDRSVSLSNVDPRLSRPRLRSPLFHAEAERVKVKTEWLVGPDDKAMNEGGRFISSAYLSSYKDAKERLPRLVPDLPTEILGETRLRVNTLDSVCGAESRAEAKERKGEEWTMRRRLLLSPRAAEKTAIEDDRVRSVPATLFGEERRSTKDAQEHGGKEADEKRKTGGLGETRELTREEIIQRAFGKAALPSSRTLLTRPAPESEPAGRNEAMVRAGERDRRLETDEDYDVRDGLTELQRMRKAKAETLLLRLKLGVAATQADLATLMSTVKRQAAELAQSHHSYLALKGKDAKLHGKKKEPGKLSASPESEAMQAVHHLAAVG